MPYNSGECELCGQYRSMRSRNGLCATCKAGSRNSSITDTVREIRNEEHREVAEAAQSLCAAGPWNYDIDSTPRDNREVLIAYKLNGRTYIEVMAYDEVDGSWWNEDRVTFTDKPFAWALLNLPEFPK